MIAHNPLHGSGQAGFPHAALALGEDADASQGIGMTVSASRSDLLTRLNTRPARSPATLRRCSREQLRMTRGRCASLTHLRMTLAFTTPRRLDRRTRRRK